MALWKIAGGRLELNLHPGQSRVWESRRRFVFMLAGTQGGKTSLGPWWLNREIYGFDDYAGRGGGDYIAATSSYDLFKLKMLPEIRTVFEHVLGRGRYWSGDKLLELRDPKTGKFWAKRSDDPMWGRIILRSAASPGGLESATGQAAWLDEVGQDEFTIEAWEAVLRRLSLSQGRVLGTTTLYNLGWLKSEVYDEWANGNDDFDVIQFASTLNPMFPPKEFERAKRSLPEWRFAMFYLGQFKRPAGLIYGDFVDRMLVDDFQIPLDWPRAVGLDFGGANMAKLYLAQDPKDERWYAYRDTLSGGKTTNEHAAEVAGVLRGVTDSVVAGGASSEGQQRLDWRADGIGVEEPLIQDVEAGIDRVTGLIKSDKFRVFKSCRGLRDELGSYRRKLDDLGEPTNEIVNKRTFHRLDALRYIVSRIGRSAIVTAYEY